MTAVMSTVGALFSYSGGATQNEAMLMKNAAAIKKPRRPISGITIRPRAIRQTWPNWRCRSVRDAANKDKYQRHRALPRREGQIKAAAESWRPNHKGFEHKSDEAMHLHHRWAQAMTGIQVAISLAAVSLLTRRRWLNYATHLAAGAGVVLGGMALAHL